MSMKSEQMYLFTVKVSKRGYEHPTERGYAVRATSFGMAYRRAMQYAMQPWMRSTYWIADPMNVEIEFVRMVTVDA